MINLRHIFKASTKKQGVSLDAQLVEINRIVDIALNKIERGQGCNTKHIAGVVALTKIKKIIKDEE